MAKLPLFFGNDNKFPFHYVRKVRITFLFAVLATLSSFAQTEKYSITGKVGTQSAPAKVYLTYRLGKTTITDSTVINRGTFQLKGQVADPVRVHLIIDNKGARIRNLKTADYIEIYLGKGQTAVFSPDFIFRAKITG